MFNKIYLSLFASILFLSQSIAYSEGSAASTASVNLSGQGMGKIVSGSADLSAAGGHLSVSSVKMVGNVAYITLKAVGASATTTVAVSTSVAGHSLVTVGQGIQVSTTATGQLLTTAGKIIAFIPNKLGKDLIYSRVV